jgi:thiamine-phosphate pyrophosphorylase
MSTPLRLIFIPDPRFRPGAKIAEMARDALRGGVDAIQLRGRELPDTELMRLAEILRRLCRESGRLFFVNDRVDVALECGADGVHLGPRDMALREARRRLGPLARIGVSVYRPEEIAEAERIGAAYIAVGAVFPTATKEVAVEGTAAVRRARERTRLPLVAIGGIGPENAAEAVAAGADGVAVISCLSRALDIAAAARNLRARITAALDTRG